MKRILGGLFVVCFGCLCIAPRAVAMSSTTLDDGIAALRLYLESDPPDPSNLGAAHAIFNGCCVSDPGNVTNRVYAAATGVLGVMTNTALQAVCSNFGITVGSVWQPQGSFDTASTQTIDQAVDAAFTQILPVFAAAYTNLDAIPTNWTGAFEIGPAQFPNELTDSVWIDIGDVLAMKAWFKTVCAVINLAHGYRLNLDYPAIDNKLLMQPAITARAIVADGQTNEWAGIQPNLLGRTNDVVRDVRVARDGANICLLMTFQPPVEPGSSSLSVWAEVNVDGAIWGLYASQDSEDGVAINWGPDGNGSDYDSDKGVWNDAALELRLPYPNATPTNIFVVDVWVDGTFNGEETGSILNFKENLPVHCLLNSQPELLAGVRNPVALATARTNLLDVGNLTLEADSVIGMRTDGLLHLVNVDPADVEAADVRQTLRAEVQRVQASLRGATNVNFLTQHDSRQFMQSVCLGALLGGVPPVGTPPAPRDLLPPLDGPVCEVSFTGAFPDPTLGGVLPGMTGAILASDLADGAKPFPLEHVSYPQISVPGRASSTNWAVVGQDVSFQAQGSVCNEGHPVAYRFDWGDGTTSAWDIVQNKSHIWNTAGIYLVRAQAMCAVDEGVVSVWSSAWTVMVSMQPTHYVRVNCATPVYPYLTWPTAATNIQDAIDAATEDNALVLVSNGVYSTGSRVYNDVYSYSTFNLANRVVIDRPITVMSVIGEPQPVILGAVDPDFTFGPGAVRCAVVANGGVLHGFILSGGSTAGGEAVYWQDKCGGGLFADASGNVEACTIAGNQAYDSGGGVVSAGMLSNCQLINNAAPSGGGAFGFDFDQNNCAGAIENCDVSGNYANGSGGGVYGFLAVHGCSVVGNVAGDGGGGASYVGLMDACVLGGNQANSGGGAFECNLSQCTVSCNSATNYGGGVYSYGDSMLVDCRVVSNSASYAGGVSYATLYSCLVVGNLALSEGGGVYDATLYNCTVANNEAGDAGGGASSAIVLNSILWGNLAPTDANFSETEIANSCTTPLPDAGAGNIAADPLFVNPVRGNYRLGAGSPCVNAGANEYADRSAVDLDGNPRIVGGVVDMGAYEVASGTPPKSGFELWASANGLAGDIGTQFTQDRNFDGVANGFEYAFGTNWSSGLPIIRIRMVGGQPVVEVPTQDADTIPYVSLVVEGRTNLLIGAWTLPIEPAPGTSEKPANRDWFRASGGTPKNAYFRLRAILP